jgi:hypothetical protein
MADVRTHRLQAAHNRQVGEALLNSGYCDWAVTACFYAALHQVDAALASCSALAVAYHPTKHEVRETTIARLSIFPQDVFDAYMKLKQGSEDARYRCARPTDKQVRTVYLPLLNQIDQFVKQKLGPLQSGRIV